MEILRRSSSCRGCGIESRAIGKLYLGLIVLDEWICLLESWMHVLDGKLHGREQRLRIRHCIADDTCCLIGIEKEPVCELDIDISGYSEFTSFRRCVLVVYLIEKLGLSLVQVERDDFTIGILYFIKMIDSPPPVSKFILELFIIKILLHRVHLGYYQEGIL